MRKKNFKNILQAFTLAETLLALLIIGILAAFTIPGIIKNYQERELAAKYKKFYSTMLQVNAKAIQDFGPMKTWRFNNTTEFVNYIKPYLNIARKCKDYPSQDCGRISGTVHYTVSPMYMLNDGTQIWIGAYPTDEKCISSFVCGGAYLDVDLNGTKGPNKRGVDVHQFAYFIHDEKFKICSSQGKDFIKK